MKTLKKKAKQSTNKNQKRRTPYFFASCPRGLEELLEKEIYEVGIKETRLKRGGVSFTCSYVKALKVLLTSRLASRVHEEIGFFFLTKEKDIYNQGIKINWPKIFRLEQSFKINTLLDIDAQKRFKNSLVLSQILKDSIVDQFRKLGRGRPNVETRNSDVSFLLRIETRAENKYAATILIDLCGETLSNRGYRKTKFEAPLRENLAAGIIMHTDWDHKTETFVDSMCGSGTLLIEAALIQGEIPPSYLKLINYKEKRMKPWAFMHHNKFLEDLRIQVEFKKFAEKLYNDARNRMYKLKDMKLYGQDIDEIAILATEESIKNSKLPASLFNLKQIDALEAIPPERKNGVVICNPPYGERMGDKVEDIEYLYHNYGENLKNKWKNFRAYIFTGKPELRKNISLQTSKRVQLYNGNIECRLFRYDLF